MTHLYRDHAQDHTARANNGNFTDQDIPILTTDLSYHTLRCAIFIQGQGDICQTRRFINISEVNLDLSGITQLAITDLHRQLILKLLLAVQGGIIGHRDFSSLAVDGKCAIRITANNLIRQAILFRVLTGNTADDSLVSRQLSDGKLRIG